MSAIYFQNMLSSIFYQQVRDQGCYCFNKYEMLQKSRIQIYVVNNFYSKSGQLISNLFGKLDKNINFARINMKTFCKIDVNIPEIQKWYIAGICRNIHNLIYSNIHFHTTIANQEIKKSLTKKYYGTGRMCKMELNEAVLN